MQRPSILLVGVLLCSSACAPSREAYHPTEHARGRTMQGYREAIYSLSTESGTFGNAKIWSPGARRVKTKLGSRTVIQVGFEIDNLGDAPASVDVRTLALQSVQAKHHVLTDIRPSRITGNAFIPPQATGRMSATFTLPPGISPEDVKAFRVRWAVAAQDKRYAELTPFAQNRPKYAYAYVPVYGYYYPFGPDDFPYYEPFDYGDDLDFDEVPLEPRRMSEAPEAIGELHEDEH